ncbi:hypothetical protein I79_005843 [Cricetulus griseus]|uniref:Uncharacterized protein n=1 Tax=Cricetulus griseus TaxID=10029 RepID=G3H689_CRIGR|nr:hypothetical protein I79_005843 [Cricetulus griseus]
MAQSPSSDTPLPTRQYLFTLPKVSPTSIQTYEPMGAILIQTNTGLKLKLGGKYLYLLSYLVSLTAPISDIAEWGS